MTHGALRTQIESYWDLDAATYDHSAGHHPQAPAERAAWAAALAEHLPAGGRVLDVGAGTGFLSLLAAELGHRVTAQDLSAEMLGRLRATAAERGLPVDAVHGDAAEPPAGPFDAVICRHLLWTLPDPAAALAAWRQVSPAGRLVVFEGLWGQDVGFERWQARAREVARQLVRRGSDHHAEYTPAMRAGLPLSGGTTPERLCQLVADAGWQPVRLHRLRDVEWLRLRSLPAVARALGVVPQFAVVAGR